MKVKKLSKSSLIFREIIEKNTRNNRTLSVLLTRALIRYPVRIFSLNFSKILLKQYLNLYKILFFKKKFYEKYLFKINIFRIECKIFLANQKLNEYVKKKIEWSNFILSSSLIEEEKKAASQYLNILKLYGYYGQKKFLVRSHKIKKIKNHKSKIRKKLYLYGPNSTLAPDLKYSKYTIVLTKPINHDISLFSNSFLILNSYTSNQLTKKDKKFLLKKYDKIYLSRSKKKIKPPFKKFDIGIGGHIASLMALGRILNQFSKMYPNSEFVIEGFDFYLSKNSYSGSTLTGFPLNFKLLTERLICESLFDHDPLFNFLYVKNIISKIRIKESYKFLNIISLTSDQYFKKLCKVRDFSSLIK
jgi:hypothetical protein